VFQRLIEQTGKKQLAPDEVWQNLLDHGIIDDRGKVQLWWNADLAIVEYRDKANGKSGAFRCLQAISGQPGMQERKLSRAQLMKQIKAGKHVITAWKDKKLDRWKEGKAVALTSNGYLRTDNRDLNEDFLEGLSASRAE
jgi:hypothetical protein